MTIRTLAPALALLAATACKKQDDVRRGDTKQEDTSDDPTQGPPPPDPVHPSGQAGPTAMQLEPLAVQHAAVGERAAADAGDAAAAGGASSAAKAACLAALHASWARLQPTLELAKIEPAAVERGYLGGGFVDRCAALPDEPRTCLVEAPDLVAGIEDCKVNDGKQASEKVWPPKLERRRDEPALAPDAAAAQLAAIVGTWVSDWESHGQRTTWVIAADGTVSETKVRKDKTETATLGLSFERAGTVKVQTTPTSSQTYGFLQTDPRTFYATNNLAYGAYRVADPKQAVVETWDGWLLLEGKRCRVVTSYGELVDATCAWKKDVLEVAFASRAGRGETRLTYHRVGGYLLDGRLVALGTFKKK